MSEQSPILRSLARRKDRLVKLRAARQAEYDGRLADMQEARALTPPVLLREIAAASGLTEGGCRYLLASDPSPLAAPTRKWPAIQRSLVRHATRIDKLTCQISAELDGRTADMERARLADPPIPVRLICEAGGMSEENFFKLQRLAKQG